MRWLRLVGPLNLQVSFAKEPNQRDDILQKRPTILTSLLIVATPYLEDKHVLISVTESCRMQYTCTHLYTYRFLYMFIYMHIYIGIYILFPHWNLVGCSAHVDMYIHIYTYVCLCTYAYICVYTYYYKYLEDTHDVIRVSFVISCAPFVLHLSSFICRLSPFDFGPSDTW